MKREGTIVIDNMNEFVLEVLTNALLKFERNINDGVFAKYSVNPGICKYIAEEVFIMTRTKVSYTFIVGLIPEFTREWLGASLTSDDSAFFWHVDEVAPRVAALNKLINHYKNLVENENKKD